MPLSDRDRETVTRLREKGPTSEWGARGALEAMRRFGDPDSREQSAISALLASANEKGAA